MPRLTLTSLRCVAALALCLAAPLLGGCAEQGEGERCDIKNDNLDCSGDLVCKTLRSLNRGATGAVCCPENGGKGICTQGDFDFSDTSPAEPATPASAEPSSPSTPGSPSGDGGSLSDAG